ncbi:ACT domain-containing protein [Shewanella yunxiaonensis]|uniref:ACT domain-containing protein n=1 Tax=Shewanella yunxiaonensis TaxID=2829809 RepID=UPI002B4A5052|nr:ACT domain-containing protein [Shewanella yunxiaonensis]
MEIVGASVYSATGIHANVVTTLANAHVSIFAISTFDTDYILLKWDKLDAALQALRSKGYKVIEYDR